MSDLRERPVRKAIVPLAGFGTRLLPMTKAVAKGMLPVIDKPVVQYVVEEAAHAGLTDLLLVTGAGQRAFAEHFSAAPDDGPEISFARQDAPHGLGDAVLRGAGFIGAEPFAILLGDNILRPGDDLLARMIAARQDLGGSIVALAQVPGDQAAGRTVADVEPARRSGVVRVAGLTENWSGPAAAPQWIMIGRCVCDPAVFAVLRGARPGHGGEIHLSDALGVLAGHDRADGGGVHGLPFGGRRFDAGSKQDFLRAHVELAAARPDLAGEFLPWLRGYVAGLLEHRPG